MHSNKHRIEGYKIKYSLEHIAKSNFGGRTVPSHLSEVDLAFNSHK